MKKIYGIIPARGGSKGIPGKNLYPLMEKPLLHYSVKAAKESKYIQKIYVSSDSEEILSYAKTQGASCIKRPKNISGDNSSSELALDHFVQNVDDFEILVFIQATSPLINCKILDKALELFLNSDCDSMISVFEDHGYWWKNNLPIEENEKRKMRQNKKKLYKESGMFYITTKKQFNKTKQRYSGNSKLFEHEKILGFEIDTIEDLKIVELIMRYKNEI